MQALLPAGSRVCFPGIDQGQTPVFGFWLRKILLSDLKQNCHAWTTRVSDFRKTAIFH